MRWGRLQQLHGLEKLQVTQSFCHDLDTQPVHQVRTGLCSRNAPVRNAVEVEALEAESSSRTAHGTGNRANTVPGIQSLSPGMVAGRAFEVFGIRIVKYQCLIHSGCVWLETWRMASLDMAFRDHLYE